MPNQYGLPRDIPDDIKRAVRKRCGFGCVICAGSVIDYEHFDPEFSRARQHIAAGITLLCPGCHAKKTRNLLSTRRVREADQNPAARHTRYAFSEIEGTAGRPVIKLAGMTLRNCETPLEVRGIPVLKFEGSEAESSPYLLTASFFNLQGRPSLFPSSFFARSVPALLLERWPNPLPSVTGSRTWSCTARPKAPRWT